MKRAFILAAALFFITALTGSAETLRLTLEQAVALGLKNSGSIDSAQLETRVAEEGVRSARASYYPGVSVSATYTHLFEEMKSDDMTLGGITIPGSYQSSQDPVTVSADVTQTITTFGKLRNAMRLAEEQEHLSMLDYEEAQRSLTVRIKRGFYGYLLALAVLEVQEQTLAFKEDALVTTRQRYDSGLIPDYEVLRVEADLESFKSDLIDAENSVEYAKLAVMNLLGIDGGEEGLQLELVGDLDEAYADLDRKDLVERAISNNHAIGFSRQALKLHDVQNELNRAQRRPTITGFAGYKISSGFDTATGDPRYWGEGAWDGDLSAGVAVQVPISSLFPWSGESARVKAGELEAEKAGADLDELASGVTLAIDNGLLTVEKQKSKIESGKKTVELAASLYESSCERYDSGLITSLDLQNAQLALNSAQLGYLQAVYGYKTALFDLMDAAGLEDL